MYLCRRVFLAALVCCGLISAAAAAQQDDAAMRQTWNRAQEPFRIFGNTFYVGTHGLAAILITSNTGHILIDGGLPESALRILANIRKAGFKPEDVKLILNSHAHYDHAGGIAQVMRASGALVAASPWSAKVLEEGRMAGDDPQFGLALDFPQVTPVLAIADGETMRVGAVTVVARFTPGHTPGGTTWTWRSCQNARCLDLVYADSLTAVSAPAFRFDRTPNAVLGFEKSFNVIAGLPCDILLTPHPEASDLFGRLEKREAGDEDALIDKDACRKLVNTARDGLSKRLAAEKAR